MPRLAWQSNEAILFYFVQNSIFRLQFVTSVREAGLSGLLFFLFPSHPLFFLTTQCTGIRRTFQTQQNMILRMTV